MLMSFRSHQPLGRPRGGGGLIPGGPVAPPLPEGWAKATILLFVIRMTNAVPSGSHQEEQSDQRGKKKRT